MGTLQSHCYAPNTQAAHRTQLKCFLHFCRSVRIVPIPLGPTNLCRYIAFLARDRAYSTVVQYLNVVRIIHLQAGLPNPLHDSFHVKSLLLGIKRLRGHKPKPKDPVSPDMLIRMHQVLNLSSIADTQFWAATLCCFYGLLRVNHVSVSVAQQGQPLNPAVFRRQDACRKPNGFVLHMRACKTVQFQEKPMYIAIPEYRGHVLCPTAALDAFLRLTPGVPLTAPLFAIPGAYLTTAGFRTRLMRLLQDLGLSELADINTHSLRRGGATWLLAQGVPLHMIRILGNWQSDAVFKYLVPDSQSKQSYLNALSPI